MLKCSRAVCKLHWSAVVAVLLLGVAIGCGSDTKSQTTLTVFAAASLTDPFGEIARHFESENPGLAVRMNFAGSQRLRSQLELGAGADVFASADETQMQLAEEAGLVTGESRRFASATMSVIVHSESGLTDVAELAIAGTSVVLSHESVPAGKYARLLLRRLARDAPSLGDDYAERVLSNVVSEETSVKFVEQKIVLGQADAGIVYHPVARTAAIDGEAIMLPLPTLEEEVRAHYPIAILEGSEVSDWAADFVAFVLSPPAQEILASYGFDGP